jgi:hypothetical protein
VGAENQEDDRYAEGRLRLAFDSAGYESVEFEMEPVAATHYYESTLDHDELILIGDFGGGTSDFSLVQVGPMVAISTTSLTDPNAVKSTVTTVSQGVHAFATPIRIVRSTLDTSCSSSSEVILIKRPKASEAVPNHQEAFMARAENLAELVCIPYLPHTASTSTAEKNRKASPYSDERPGWTGPSAAVGTTGGAAFFNCSSSA